MAERRMFAKSIVLSDAFLDMPLSARCLYFTLGMLADDDGFISSPKAIMRQCGASQDDMSVLLSKRYVLMFDSGVIVIKHWRMNNYLRSDRYHTTTYLEEKDTLTVDDRGAYTEKYDVSAIPDGIPGGIPSDDKWYTQDSIGKDSIDKDNNILSSFVSEIIDYLNSKAGTRYSKTSKQTISHIKARLDEGFTVEDFKTVIDKKAKWKQDPKMCTYLRPETLFCPSHFESYLNEIEVQSVAPAQLDVPKTVYDKIHNYAERDVDYAALGAELLK